MFTWGFLVVLGHAEDLQRADSVHGVHAIVKRNEDLDGLIKPFRLLDDRTHLAAYRNGSLSRLLMV